MGTNGRTRIALAVAAALVLVAVTVFAAREAIAPAPAEQVVACGGECATCPYADSCSKADPVTGDGAPCVTVTDRCFGCGQCVKAAPDAFRINPQTGKAEVIPGAPADAVARGAAACPIGAIKR